MSSFKVIVVGAGPVGLVLAHALQAAGIDFVLVEQRRQVPPDPAYGLFIWPQIMRIFHQLGLLDVISAVSQPMEEAIHRSIDGKVLHQEEGFKRLAVMFGYPMSIFSRLDFASTLLNAIPNKEERVKTNKRLSKITQDKKGVRVEFADGTFEEGSVVVGADGVWSSVRDQMVAQASKGLFDETPNPFEATHAGVFAKADLVPGLEKGRNINVYQKDAHVQVFTTRAEAMIIVYHRIPAERKRTYFGQNDAEEAARPWLDVRVGDELTFGDLWRNKTAGGTANYDEGVLPIWHWGRMVLVGDAAHKMNPIRGAGACCGIEDTIALVNSLKRALRSNPNPRGFELSQAFVAYQHEREAAAKIWMEISRMNLELCIGPNQPALRAASIADSKCLPMVADAPILDDVPFPEMSGFIPWTKKVRGQKRDEEVKAKL
ncbi:6-hydroxynicotinate 3-monooxygenase [Fusarium longipes]|uniref:6-hydroxynicotinate 3-monooxygenase n=1 Tax=Fusarium longipes TaxID=694270 RepID=A0A395T4E3_9HYPO|nr:6-hydroxynicotinate 3-monooxygenase [Fusarium longipes]